MARLNDFLKFFLINVNIFFTVIGTFFFGFSLYLLFGDFGELDRGFFAGTGLICMFIGLNIIFASCIGCQGLNNQNKRFGGFWTGRKIIFIYEVLLVFTLVAEIFILSISLEASGEFKDIYPILEDIQNGADLEVPAYSGLEHVISEKFNTFFFGATSKCDAALYSFFWSWVDDFCPSDMSQQLCEGCEEYSITLCPADEHTCFSTSDGDGAACPYTLCRADILRYFSIRIEPVSYAVMILSFFQVIVVLMNMTVMCFHPRDDLEKILIKSGTISAPVHHA